MDYPPAIGQPMGHGEVHVWGVAKIDGWSCGFRGCIGDHVQIGKPHLRGTGLVGHIEISRQQAD